LARPGVGELRILDHDSVEAGALRASMPGYQDSCGHRQAPLSKGTLEGHVIAGPLHFAQFDVRTGKLLTGPAAADIPTYQVRLEGDSVYVKR